MKRTSAGSLQWKNFCWQGLSKLTQWRTLSLWFGYSFRQECRIGQRKENVSSLTCLTCSIPTSAWPGEQRRGWGGLGPGKRMEGQSLCSVPWGCEHRGWTLGSRSLSNSAHRSCLLISKLPWARPSPCPTQLSPLPDFSGLPQSKHQVSLHCWDQGNGTAVKQLIPFLWVCGYFE